MCNVFVCPEHPGCTWARVRPHENLRCLARRLGTTPGRLLELNPYLDPSEMIEDMPVLAPLLHVYYGQTTESVCRSASLTEADFFAINPHIPPQFPLPGQRYRRG